MSSSGKLSQSLFAKWMAEMAHLEMLSQLAEWCSRDEELCSGTPKRLSLRKVPLKSSNWTPRLIVQRAGVSGDVGDKDVMRLKDAD